MEGGAETKVSVTHLLFPRSPSDAVSEDIQIDIQVARFIFGEHGIGTPCRRIEQIVIIDTAKPVRN